MNSAGFTCAKYNNCLGRDSAVALAVWPHYILYFIYLLLDFYTAPIMTDSEGFTVLQMNINVTT